MPLMAFFVPLDGRLFCAVASEGKPKTSADTVKKANVARSISKPSLILTLVYGLGSCGW